MQEAILHRRAMLSPSVHLQGVGHLQPAQEDHRQMNYQGSRWKKTRLHVLRMDGYKCQVARWYGRSEEAQTVHHIYPVKDYPEYQWCYWNMISVSNASHNMLENRKTGELTELGMQLMRRTVPGVDWRKKKYATR